MKKTTLLGILASGTLLFGSAMPVMAAATSTADTDATVTFKENNTGPTTPVDPEDPDIDNPGVPGTGNEGPLSLDYASTFDFGTHDVPTTDQVYTALDDTAGDGSTANYVQVTDQRAGEVKGWTLSVAQNGQLTAEKSARTLDGAQIQIGTGTVKTGSENTSGTPVSSTVALDTNGASSVVMDAAAGNGFGTWVDAFGTKGSSTVKLAVPVESHPDADKYTSKLTWTLSELPDNA